MIRAYLALGSNLGDRLDLLVQAARALEVPGIHLLRTSSVFETPPWGVQEQPAFLNMVVEVETARDPISLLRHAQQVEQRLGRVRRLRWGPRTIDIDLILYGQTRLTSPELELPHPRLTERAFVLVPLLELVPDLSLPVGADQPQPLSLAPLLEALADQEAERVLDGASFLKRVRGVQ